MGYCIRYNSELNKKYPEYRQNHKKVPVIKYALIVSVIILSFVLVRKKYPNFFIPGDPNITTAAFSSFISQMRAGEPIKESLIYFCKYIITAA